MTDKKTISQAFRFDVDTQKILVDEAHRQRVSLNVLVGHVLEDYAKWGIMTDRAKVVSLGPPVIAAIFRACSEEVVMKMGTELGKTHPIEMLASGGLAFVPESVKVLLEVWLCKYAHWFEPLEIKIDNETWQIHLIHGISRKWSLFLGEYMASMFKELGFQLKDKIVHPYSTTLKLKALDR